MENFSDLTFIGLISLGVVNVLSFFYPKLDSRIKFGASVVVAFAMTFVPVDIGILIVDKAKVALEVAFAASGGYRLAQKAGGN